ncbi:MAG TPA: TetR/AcrR family transcriptional regulator [Acidimicrobiales bacterium]|nr:TetR/AcrR family transcriptional regulator [Acidimicrobiales bacterium]
MSITAKKPRGSVGKPEDGPVGDGETATQRRVIDAAVACILECGFYRASTNEIARRAGVTWGVIQHYFGTREALMLAVLQDGARQFAELMEDAHIEGDTTEDRVEQLMDVLTSHYGQPEFLAYLQVLLNMDHDPRTSVEVRKTMREVAARSQDHVRRLLREALGPANSTPDLAITVFLVLRGFAISQQLQGTMAYDVSAPKADRATRQRRILAGILAPYLEEN